MHTTFRTLGQQMGMQMGRAILPESIDVCLNSSIIELTQEGLLGGVNNTIESGVTTQASTMSVINAFRNLYKSVRYKCDNSYADVQIVAHVNEDKSYTVINIPIDNTSKTRSNIAGSAEKINPMMYLGFAVEYDDKSEGKAKQCRVVAQDEIGNILNDFCSYPSRLYPVAVLNNRPSVWENIHTDVTNEFLEIYTDKGCPITYLTIKYIKHPNIVKFDKDLAKCVNCDLPEYLHYEVVERAVAKFKSAISTAKPAQ